MDGAALGLGVSTSLQSYGEKASVEQPTGSQLLIEGGTDALLIEGGTDALLLEA